MMTDTVTQNPAGNAAPVRQDALRLRPGEERGHADHGWLRTAHSFSFAGYHDPRHMGFEALRVINDDVIKGGAGFPTHPHRDAEIFSYVMDGALSHADTMGTRSTVAAGGVQFMTAGSGVAHSEFNASATEAVRLLQIWLLPKRLGVTPRYETLDLSPGDKAGRLLPIVTEDGEKGGIATHAAADVYAGTFDGAERADFTLREGRRAWIQVARGALSVNGMTLTEGDGLAVMEPGLLTFGEGQGADVLLFDLARVRTA
jgi:redox-sensitive bicupin YhaK (pirin superfamily)